MKYNKVFIDKDKLAYYTDNGRDIYKMIFPDLREADSNRYENVLNPFYKDGNGSLSIYKGKDWWRHNDFGDESFSGDALDIAACYYDIDRKTDFAELLRRIADDLKINIQKIQKHYNNTYDDLEWWKDEEGLDAAYSYFSNYGITKEVLKRYCVRAIKHMVTVDKDGSPRRVWFPKDKIVIAYEDTNHTKLYSPGDRDYKFRYVGKKPKDFVFGLSQILTDIHKTKNYDRGTLVITGGEKDVLTLVSLGYDAISLNSETARLPLNLTEGLFHAYSKVVVLYDLDETGQRNATKLVHEHKLSLCRLPETLKLKGGKDVSDYVRLGMSTDELRGLIENSVSDISIIDHYDEEPRQAEKETENTSTENLTGVGFLPEEVYSLLPQTLKNICGLFNDRRDKDVCLLSCITVLSSCLPNIKGIYGGKRVGCNINLFITAPASAGKGVMSWSRLLGSSISQYLEQKYEDMYKQYERDLASYQSKKSEGYDCEKPKKPKEQHLFIPANISTSSMIEYLDANQNFGIMFDNEGDTLSSVMKNDWADFSSLVRKAFHHEYVSMARRVDREHREIEKPHLSLLLSGTRDQVSRLIDSVENGLFSRFMFYDFDSEIVWKNMFDDGNCNLEKQFESYSEQILKYWIYGEKNGNTIYLLDETQKKDITSYFGEKLSEMYKLYGEDIVGSVKRTCLIYYRIAMLLSAIRNYEVMNLNVNKMPEKMIVAESQSRCAFLIVDTLLTHLEFVFTRLKSTGTLSKLNHKQRSLYEALPRSFTWQEFKCIAGEIEIGYDAAQKYRRDFIKLKLILNCDHGKYKRL